MTSYYDPWKLGVLTGYITITITPIKKLDKSKEYVVTTNELLTEDYNFNKPIAEIDWAEFHTKHHDYTTTEDVKTTDSIFMWAEGDDANKNWKWCKYGGRKLDGKDITDDEFIRWIQHEDKVLVVTSISCGGRRCFSNGDVEEIGNNEWKVNDGYRPSARPKKVTKKNLAAEQVDLFATGNYEWISTKR